ncbi:hypothetical protein [Candidatus Agathobaculum pullicola]|uniref:hypothetical protein n=1 Tax=Candidatus Agathobaculum pullicola TaxID=2838426 RepID=UPI003F8E3F65
MKKQLSTPVLAVLAIASWLATSSLATWLNYAYDGALNVNPVYLWIYGAITLLIPLVAVEYIERDPPDRSPRWAGALLLLLCTAIAYLALAYGGWYVWYQPSVWYLCLLGLIGISAWLYHILPFRRPMQPRSARSRIQNTFILLLVFYTPLLVVLPLYLLIMHPASVAQITPVGEAEGGRYIGRITGDRTENPLGLYFFVDDDSERWYYYDVLTSEPADYG